jgi:hypothetical protein
MKITLGEKEYDLVQAMPITLGDIRRLRKEYNIKMSDLAAMDADIVATVLLMLCKKVDAGITEDMVNSLPLTMLGKVAKFLSDAASPETVLDRPILG